jgi:hypothetical protein
VSVRRSWGRSPRWSPEWEGDVGIGLSYHNKDDETTETGYFERALFHPILSVEPWNEGSWRAAERVGYQHEGLMRSWERVGDQRRDMYMYSLLSTDDLWPQPAP